MNFFFKTKNLLPFLNSKYKSIPSSKIVRELLLLLNNSVSLRSLMQILGSTVTLEKIVRRQKNSVSLPIQILKKAKHNL